MFTLPLLPPQNHSTLHTSTPFRPRPDSPPPPATTNTQQPPTYAARQAQQRRDEERKLHNTRSPLALLAADEAAIAARKAAIRNFGAYWIRPPGAGKTLQAMHEEEAERIEQEELGRQEQAVLDMQAQQRLAEAQQEGAEAEGEGEGVEERDLDDEIPEADEAGEVTEEVSFNEDSMLDGSHLVPQGEDDEVGEGEEELELEEAELTGAAQAEEELGLTQDYERDLDDSVPEAGSYQHTDTEVEDSSDIDTDLQDSFAQQSARRSARQQPQQRNVLQMQPPSLGGGLHDRMRAQVGAADALPRSPGSLHLSSSMLESSFVGSSPVMQRGSHGGRARGRRGRGRMS